MKTDDLREAYLKFFESKGCTRRPSDSIVPKDDPTVFFTPAGMNQFKPEFLNGPTTFAKATTCQKCLRTNDIENVGVTAYHHSAFEMLGNFSFGDYFKEEAITWAWEFLTSADWLGLDPDRLSVTVYKDDDEAYDLWKDKIGVHPDRIAREDEDENFWPASAPSEGPDGVCGPCSEIYYHPTKITGVPNNDDGVEIWNLVFTQFERKGDPPNNLTPLPMKNIDTGMGLERTAAAIQEVRSNFEIDTLRPLCEAAGKAVGVKYDFDAPEGRACRRIADHVRAITLAMHEGTNPGDADAAYTVRLLLRRAAMEGFFLGKEEPFLYTLVDAVCESFKVPYPELRDTAKSVADGIKAEEEQFLETLERGLARFEKIAAGTTDKIISGKDAFTLHAQDGFFIQITRALAERKGMTVDEDGFNAAMKEHEVISRGGKEFGVMAAGPMDAIRKKQETTEFLGYPSADDAGVEANGTVIGLIANQELVDSVDSSSGDVAIVLDKTPFYGEAGGQVGDTGSLEANDKGKTTKKAVITDTQKDGNVIVHLGRVTVGEIKVGDTLTGHVDADRRAGIRRAHSATHILHHALHETLGKDALQRGSKVQQDELRFDFSHGSSITPDELRRIEDIVNECVATGADVVTELLPIDEARAKGAMALFGEKYPDLVRVVQMGGFSTELCGGTHLGNTGQVGLVRVLGDDAVSKGVRRITALTGPKALEAMRENERLLREASIALKAPRRQSYQPASPNFRTNSKRPNPNWPSTPNNRSADSSTNSSLARPSSATPKSSPTCVKASTAMPCATSPTSCEPKAAKKSPSSSARTSTAKPPSSPPSAKR